MLQKTNAVTVRTIGIDTGKNTFHLIGLDELGTIVLREKLARGRIGRRLANASPCLIGIEAGMATHYVARELLALGHDVRQVPPAYAKPFRQGHKNDFRDAYAIAEAVLRPSTRRVPVRTVRGYPLWPRAPKLYSRAGYRSARPIPPSLTSGLQHESCYGVLKRLPVANMETNTTETL